MNTPPAAFAARASGCDVLVTGGGPAGLATAAVPYGDVFGKPPIYGPLWLFKGLQSAAPWLNIRRTFTLKALRMRKHNIRVVDETGAAVN